MKYIKPAKLLGIYALINIILVAVAVFAKGDVAVYSLVVKF